MCKIEFDWKTHTCIIAFEIMKKFVGNQNLQEIQIVRKFTQNYIFGYNSVAHQTV